MKVFVVVLVVFVAVVAVIAMTGVLDEGPAMPVAVDIPVPAGAMVLEEGFGPDDVAMSVAGSAVSLPGMGGSGGAQPSEFVGWWTPPRGWYANLMKMKKADGVTRMSLDVQGTKLGSVYVYLTIPGDAGEIPESKKVRFRGRIVSVTPSDRIDIKPHKIELDQVTILHVGG